MFPICLQNESLSYLLPNLMPPTSYSATLVLLSGEVMCLTASIHLEREERIQDGWMDGDKVHCKKL